MSSQHAIGLHQRSRAYLLGTLTLPHHVNLAVLFGVGEGSSNLVRRSLPMRSPVLVWVVYPATWSIGAQEPYPESRKVVPSVPPLPSLKLHLLTHPI